MLCVLLCWSCILQKKVNPSQFILSPQTIRESKASLAEHEHLFCCYCFTGIFTCECVCMCAQNITNTLTIQPGRKCFPLNLCYFKEGKQTGFANRTSTKSNEASLEEYSCGFIPRRSLFCSLAASPTAVAWKLQLRTFVWFPSETLEKRVPPRLKVNGD